MPMYDPYSHLVYAARPSDVRTVIIEGHVVLNDADADHRRRGRCSRG